MGFGTVIHHGRWNPERSDEIGRWTPKLRSPRPIQIRHYAWLDHARICADMGASVCVLLSYMSDTTLDALLALSRDRLERVAPHELAAAVSNGAVVVDVRDSAQRAEQGGLPGSHVIDLTVLEWRLAPSSDSRTVELPPDQRVILVCSDGCSSSLAAARLQDLGVKGATDLQGGYRAWATSRRSM